MRADRQPDIEFLPQIQILDLHHRKGVAKARNRHDIRVTFAFQLDDISMSDRCPHFGSWPTDFPPKLERSQPIAVDAGADIGRTSVERAAHHPTHFAMGVEIGTGKGRLHGDNKIAPQAPPDIVKGVLRRPNVSAGAGDGIALAGGIIGAGTLVLHCPYSGLLGKETKRCSVDSRYRRYVHRYLLSYQQFCRSPTQDADGTALGLMENIPGILAQSQRFCKMKEMPI